MKFKTWICSMHITSFKVITMFCGIDSFHRIYLKILPLKLQEPLIYFPNVGNQEIFCGILFIPQNIVMDLNNVMHIVTFNFQAFYF